MPTSEADRQRFRAVMGHFPTGVAVVTARANGGAVGMTTNALCSLSLDPLLVLVCFDNGARTLPAVRETGRFAVNVLRAGQADVSGRFASKLPRDEKFAEVDHSHDHGAPVLHEALAWVVCDVTEWIAGGDHTIAIGAVTEMGHGEGDPLVWYRGAYTELSPRESREPSGPR